MGNLLDSVSVQQIVHWADFAHFVLPAMQNWSDSGGHKYSHRQGENTGGKLKSLRTIFIIKFSNPYLKRVCVLLDHHQSLFYSWID